MLFRSFAFLGSGGFFYTHGVGFWAAGTWTVLVGGITYVLAPRIWALGKAFGYITPADMLADFYESEGVRVAVAKPDSKGVRIDSEISVGSLKRSWDHHLVSGRPQLRRGHESGLARRPFGWINQ